jgi:hypothetical protein
MRGDLKWHPNILNWYKTIDKVNTILLNLPHRQFVFTMPKALRPFFRHDLRLFAEISRLIYTIISEFCAAAAGKPLLSRVIATQQTFGGRLHWNPNYHCPVLEGGFDEHGTFIPVPLSGLDQMTEVFRRRLIWAKTGRAPPGFDPTLLN